MYSAFTVARETRGLRFSFDADAEVAPENSPAQRVRARVTELSLRGCFVKAATHFEEQRRVLLKVFHSGQYFEAEAAVLYSRQDGMGLVFCEVKPHCRAVLQKWVLTALQLQSESADPVAAEG